MTHVTMEVGAHLEGLRRAMVAFVRYAEAAGPTAPVPTTPDWTVRRLVAHQGMVHRWAAAILRGEEPRKGANPEAWESRGMNEENPLEWLREGSLEVATAIATAPDDLDALVFLADAPSPRAFWARRQCHETTVHAVDALSARLGRHPVAGDADWIEPALALDGIDELLTGFLPRPVSRLRCDEPQRIVVLPDEGDLAWQVEVGPRPPVTTRLSRSDVPDADVQLAGGAVALYLTLWNRSDEVAPTGEWDLWRDSWNGGAQVRWSR